MDQRSWHDSTFPWCFPCFSVCSYKTSSLAWCNILIKRKSAVGECSHASSVSAAGSDNVNRAQHLLWGLALMLSLFWPSFGSSLDSPLTKLTSADWSSNTLLMLQYDTTKATVFRLWVKQNELWKAFPSSWLLEIWRPSLEQETQTWSVFSLSSIGCDSALKENFTIINTNTNTIILGDYEMIKTVFDYGIEYSARALQLASMKRAAV